MTKESMVPLEDVQTDRINTRGLVLPPYIRGKIGIDLDRTVRLMNIGGIGYLNVTTSDKDSARPQVNTIHSKGFATKGSLWKTVSLELHEKDMVEKTQDKYGTVASPVPWAKNYKQRSKKYNKKRGG